MSLTWSASSSNARLPLTVQQLWSFLAPFITKTSFSCSCALSSTHTHVTFCFFVTYTIHIYYYFLFSIWLTTYIHNFISKTHLNKLLGITKIKSNLYISLNYFFCSSPTTTHCALFFSLPSPFHCTQNKSLLSLLTPFPFIKVPHIPFSPRSVTITPTLSPLMPIFFTVE